MVNKYTVTHNTKLIPKYVHHHLRVFGWEKINPRRNININKQHRARCEPRRSDSDWGYEHEPVVNATETSSPLCPQREACRDITTNNYTEKLELSVGGVSALVPHHSRLRLWAFGTARVLGVRGNTRDYLVYGAPQIRTNPTSMQQKL